MDDRFIMIGLSNGSVSCIYVFNGVLKWNVPVSDVAITAVLTDVYDIGMEQRFYAGDAIGNIFLINEKGQITRKIRTKGYRIFGILASSPRNIVVYYDGGAAGYEFEESKVSLIDEYTSTGDYSIDADGTFHHARVKVSF